MRPSTLSAVLTARPRESADDGGGWIRGDNGGGWIRGGQRVPVDTGRRRVPVDTRRRRQVATRRRFKWESIRPRTQTTPSGVNRRNVGRDSLFASILHVLNVGSDPTLSAVFLEPTWADGDTPPCPLFSCRQERRRSPEDGNDCGEENDACRRTGEQRTQWCC